MLFKLLLALLISLSILFTAIGQQPKPTPETQKPSSAQPQSSTDPDSQDVVKITTNLVQVDVVVTKDGKPITDLRPEDFEVSEDGKPQTITNFSYVSNMSGNAPAKTTPAAKANDATATLVPPAKIDPGDQRRTVALVIDDLGISWESMTHVRNQVRKFLDDVSPNDLVAIIRTGGDVGSLQQFTNDRRVLQNAANRLQWNPCSRAGLHVFARAGSEEHNTGLCSEYIMNTTLKSLRFIIRGMSYMPGRKSLIFFSDYLPIQDQQPSAYEETRTTLGDSTGNDAASTEVAEQNLPDTGTSYAAQLQKIAELAIRSSVVIYSVDTRGLQYTGLTAADRLTARGPEAMTSQMNSIMRSRSALLISGREGSDLIAKQTGGFLIRNSNDFGLKQIMQDQQGYYLIGFRPVEQTFNRNFHHIKARVKRGGFTVRTRAGFYGFTDEEARPKELSITDEMTKALMSPFNAKDITVRLTSFFVDDPAQGPVVRSFLYLDSRDLNFTEADGWQSTTLDIKTVVFGDNGRVIAKEDRSGRLRFRAGGYDRAVREGITYSFDIPLKARGAFQFRVAVRDVSSDRIGSAGQFIELPNLRNEALALSGIVARVLPTSGVAPDVEPVASGPAVRQFHQGATLVFAHEIYNANRQGRPAQLSARLRIIRDGKVVFTGDPTPVSIDPQSDQLRLMNAMKLQLGSELTPGDYVCQIIVTDSSDSKPRIASQWIDFEIIK